MVARTAVATLLALCLTISLFYTLQHSHRLADSSHRSLFLRNRLPLFMTRIVGGRPAVPKAHPAYAFTAGNTLCGATLIFPDVLLSAAHCEGVFLSGVFIGGVQIDGSDGRRVGVRKEIPHPDFDNITAANDIMLVLLQTTVDDIPLQRLHVGGTNLNLLDNGVPVTAIGYGHTSENGTASSTLQTVSLTTVDYDTCQAEFGNRLTNDMMCASTTGGKDTCRGDSGGPLLYPSTTPDQGNTIQVGVISFGDGCARPDSTAAVYSRVHVAADWMARTICRESAVPPSTCADDSNPMATPVVPVPAPIVPVAPVPMESHTTGEPTVFSFDSITVSPSTRRPTTRPPTSASITARPTTPVPIVPRPSPFEPDTPTQPTSEELSDWFLGPRQPTVPSPVAPPNDRPTSANILDWIRFRGPFKTRR